MNINRNNYEEFFLMYVDNELPAAQRKIVESFVRDNPDLEEELALLQQSKLTPENNLSFEQKGLLFKSEIDDWINQTNYEEFFLLYVDNELDEEVKRAVEKFALKHPHAKTELEILKKARLEPDHDIIFKGKENLYRKEERKIIWMPWLRVASAVLIIVMAGLFVYVYKSSHTTPHIAKTESDNNTGSKNNDSAEKNKQVVTSAPVDTLNNTNAAKQTASKQNNQEKRIPQRVKDMQKDNTDKIKPEVAKNNTRENKNIETANLKKDVPIASAISEKDASLVNTNKIALQPAVADVITAKTNVSATDVAIGTNDNNSFIKQAVYEESKGDPENDVNFMTFSAKKNKMRGIFRKVTRVFDKTTNVDDGKRKVLVGNFQIALN